MKSLLLTTLTLFLTVLSPTSAPARDLYFTDFSMFPAGDDQLIGQDGWQGTNPGEGVHGIVNELVTGLGKSAFLGFGQPSSSFVRVTRGITSQETPHPTVRFLAFLGVARSSAGGNDIFNVSFYNSDDTLLAAIKFDTRPLTFGIWRSNGSTTTDTEESFVLDEVQVLLVEIDYLRNRWSVTLDGFPVLQDALFTAHTGPRDFGNVSLEWQVTAPANPGNNWLLFDNLAVSIPNIRIDSVETAADGAITIEWFAPEIADYQVQISSTLKEWSDLHGAVVHADSHGTSIRYTDATARSVTHRFYQVKQLPGTP